MIIASKNPNLFPHLNIPRTTALYWIAQGHKESSTTSLSQEGQELRNRLNEYEVFKLKAINLMLKDLLKSTNPYADFKSSADPNVKSRVMDLVESMNGFIPKTSLIHDLGLSPSTYYRWKSERLGCDFEKIKCHSGRPAQLTIDEQKIIVSLARDPRLKQLSTKSLMYYAQRNGIIDCSLDSWYKYMKIYKIDRKVNKGGKRKRYLEGVRANKVNDIWHIDITQFYSKNRKKLYVQSIVDNYSRTIINWKVSDRKNTQITLKSLLDSDLDTHRPEYLMSDGGGENCNKEVKKVLTGKELFEFLLEALKEGELIIDLKDKRKYKGEKSIKRSPKSFVIKIKETKTGANIEFFDVRKKMLMTKENFISAIKQGKYPGYAVKRHQSGEFPYSTRDRFSFNNLG